MEFSLYRSYLTMSPGVKYRFRLVRCMISPSGKNINNDTLEYLLGEVLTDIRALAISLCA